MDVFKNQQFTLQKSFTVKFSQQRSVHTRRNQSFRNRKALGLLRRSPQGSSCAGTDCPICPPSSVDVQSLVCLPCTERLQTIPASQCGGRKFLHPPLCQNGGFDGLQLGAWLGAVQCRVCGSHRPLYELNILVIQLALG